MSSAQLVSVAASRMLASKRVAGASRDRRAPMVRLNNRVTTMNIRHSPSAAISDSVAPISGVSIKALRRVDELSMGRVSEQLLPVFIEVAQRIVNGIDHR